MYLESIMHVWSQGGTPDNQPLPYLVSLLGTPYSLAGKSRMKLWRYSLSVTFKGYGMACKCVLELDPSDEIKFRVDKRPHVEMTRELRHISQALP
jgi:hypothetical protein